MSLTIIATDEATRNKTNFLQPVLTQVYDLPSAALRIVASATRSPLPSGPETSLPNGTTVATSVTRESVELDVILPPNADEQAVQARISAFLHSLYPGEHIKCDCQQNHIQAIGPTINYDA